MKAKLPFFIDAIVLASAVIICLPLRMLQYGDGIEVYTGFYTNFGINFIIFYAVLAAAIIYFIVSSLLKRNKYHLDTSAAKFPGCGVFSALTSLAVLYSAFQSYSLKERETAAYVVSSKVPEIVFLLQEFFAILSAVFFLILAISLLTGKDSSRFRILALCPVVWNILRLVLHFTVTVSYTRVSDLMLDMLALAFYSVFFMAFAQSNSGINSEGAVWRLTVFGLGGALLGLICFIPRAVLLVMGRGTQIFVLSTADVSDLAIALFCVSTVLTRLAPGKTDERVEEKTE